MTEHPPLEVLADAVEGLLEPDRQARVDAHLAGCEECRAEVAALAEVSDLLAEVPAPAIPAAVADRLARVLVDEQDRRARPGALHVVTDDERTPAMTVEIPAAVAPAVAGRGVPDRRPRRGSPRPAVPAHPYGTAARPHPQLGRFGADLHKVSAGRRWAVPALVAAVCALVVGFGAYVASASLGLNEPPAVAVSVNDGQLAAQAKALRNRADLEPHRFSQAWWCARKVTQGRIVGLAVASTNGQDALLVYLQRDTGVAVVVVTGCSTSQPSAGPSVSLGR